MSRERPVPHNFEGEELESVFVGRRDGQARPTVILIPTVMGVSEDARVARGLPAPGLGGFEAEGVHPGTRESVGRGQPDDSGADDGDLGSALHPPR